MGSGQTREVNILKNKLMLPIVQRGHVTTNRSLQTEYMTTFLEGKIRGT